MDVAGKAKNQSTPGRAVSAVVRGESECVCCEAVPRRGCREWRRAHADTFLHEQPLSSFVGLFVVIFLHTEPTQSPSKTVHVSFFLSVQDSAGVLTPFTQHSDLPVHVLFVAPPRAVCTSANTSSIVSVRHMTILLWK